MTTYKVFISEKYAFSLDEETMESLDLSLRKYFDYYGHATIIAQIGYENACVQEKSKGIKLTHWDSSMMQKISTIWFSDNPNKQYSIKIKN